MEGGFLDLYGGRWLRFERQEDSAREVTGPMTSVTGQICGSRLKRPWKPQGPRRGSRGQPHATEAQGSTLAHGIGVWAYGRRGSSAPPSPGPSEACLCRTGGRAARGAK